MKNIHIVSLGCARNLVDSEIMLGLLSEKGYQVTDREKEAEIVIVNTCGFIDSAKQESVDTILEAAHLKEVGKCETLVVTGCLSERHPDEIKAEIPEIDIIMGSSGFASIVEEIEKNDEVDRVRLGHERHKDYDLPRVNTLGKGRAYLKLAEGCAKRCNFCVIPDLRGKLRSRSETSLVKEAMILSQQGVKELNLIAQDLTDYGRDRNDNASLQSVLKKLTKVKGIDWLRLFYCYPDQFSDDVISLIRDEEKICNYVDMPIQHIDDLMLKRMNRKTNEAQVLSVVEKLKTNIPDLVIRSSLMVGFPGETEEQFNKLKKFVSSGLIDQLGIFTYSHEEGAPSQKFSDDVPQAIKNERQKELYQIQAQLAEDKLQSWVGRTLKVLVEGPHPETELLLVGRHYGQAPDVDNQTLINEGVAEIGEFVNLKINEVVGMDIMGSVEPS